MVTHIHCPCSILEQEIPSSQILYKKIRWKKFNKAHFPVFALTNWPTLAGQSTSQYCNQVFGLKVKLAYSEANSIVVLTNNPWNFIKLLGLEVGING